MYLYVLGRASFIFLRVVCSCVIQELNKILEIKVAELVPTHSILNQIVDYITLVIFYLISSYLVEC